MPDQVRNDCAFCHRERSAKDDNHAPECPYWSIGPGRYAWMERIQDAVATFIESEGADTSKIEALPPDDIRDLKAIVAGLVRQFPEEDFR